MESAARPAVAASGRTWRRLATPLLLAVLLALSAWSRIYSVNAAASEPTSDEYLYALYARDLARSWSGGDPVPLDAAAEEGRLIALQGAAAAFLVGWDQVTLGRTIQALLNTLGILAAFLLARAAGIGTAGALAAALLLLAVPELQESAWRNWPDSQATLLVTLYLAALLAFVRRRSWRAGVIAAVLVLLLLVTKDSAAVTVAPFLVLLPLVYLWPRRRHVVLGMGLAILALGAGLALPGSAALADALDSLPIIGKPIRAAALIPEALGAALPRVPEYGARVAELLGSLQLSGAFLWVWLLGGLALAVTAASGRRPMARGAAALVWLPTLALPYLALRATDRPEPWVALIAAAAVLALAVGARPSADRGPWTEARPWALVLLGAVVLAFLGQRLLLTALPRLGTGAAFTVRSFFPILPLCAVLGGYGLSVLGGSLASLVAGRWRAAVPVAAGAATLVASLLLVLLATPLWERTSDRPLLGRRADRGADPTTPMGLRVEALVEAEDWLRGNLRPTDVVLTGIPRHLAWYADAGVEGLGRFIDLGSQPRTQAERGAYIRDRVGPDGVDYVVDFNIAWTRPDAEDAREWRQTYEWLASQPNLEVAYLRRDWYGQPVLYVVRNHGYAAAPASPDSKEGRART